MPLAVSHAANDDFYTSLTIYSTLDCAIWLIWHRKVRVRDIATAIHNT